MSLYVPSRPCISFYFLILAHHIQGIYLTDDEAKTKGFDSGFGIRLEDPVLVVDDLRVLLLTGQRASSPWDP